MCLAEDLEPVADTKHRSTLSRMVLNRLHDGAEPGDRSGAEVVAVAEPSGQDHDVRPPKVGIAMPHEIRMRPHAFGGTQRIVVAIAAREAHDGNVQHQASSTTSR